MCTRMPGVVLLYIDLYEQIPVQQQSHHKQYVDQTSQFYRFLRDIVRGMQGEKIQPWKRTYNIRHTNRIWQVAAVELIFQRKFLFLNHYVDFAAQLVSYYRRFYPQRSSGQAVVTGVLPSPPRYVPSILSRIGFSTPTARRFSSYIANSRSRAFRNDTRSLQRARGRQAPRSTNSAYVRTPFTASTAVACCCALIGIIPDKKS